MASARASANLLVRSYLKTEVSLSRLQLSRLQPLSLSGSVAGKFSEDVCCEGCGSGIAPLLLMLLLPKSVVQSDDPEWFFFCPRKAKYSTGRRSQRNTKRGHWKITGKERKVKDKTTKAVIGTKRTLVFYEGKPGPGPRRTNWVMHEYSRVSTHPNQKPYVVCRLKKKSDETEISTCAEPEPSGYEAGPSHVRVASTNFDNHVEEDNTIPEVYYHQEPDLESLLEQPQDIDFSALRSLMQGEQHSPRVEFSFSNDFNDYDYNGLQFQSGASEQEGDLSEFLNSIIVEQGEGECLSIQATADYNSPAESLRRQYMEDTIVSSDTDAEVFRPRYRQILEGLSNELTSSNECERMPTMVLQCSGHEGHNRAKNVARYEFKRPNASSLESTADHYYSINCLEVKEEFPSVHLRTYEPQPFKSSDLGTKRVVRDSRGGSSVKAPSQMKGRQALGGSSSVIGVVKKGLNKVESDIDSKCSQETKPKLNLKPRSNGSGDGNSKGSFIVMETPSLQREPSLSLVYFVNAIVGAVLFIFMLCELASLHGGR